MFFTGPAGTGKTTWAKQIAARFGRPFLRISCNDQTDAPTLVGQPALADGSTAWEDRQLVAAIRRPGTVILIDEPSASRPGAMMILQAVLDDDRALQIPDTGEVVHVAPGVVFVLADNTASEAPHKSRAAGAAQPGYCTGADTVRRDPDQPLNLTRPAQQPGANFCA